MRVLLVINRLEDHGGAEVSTVGLLDSLQGSVADFTVLTLFGAADFELRPELEARGARFVTAPPEPMQRLRSLSRLAKSARPDVIHSTLFDSDLVARVVGPLRRIPVLSSLVNTEYSAEAIAAARAPRKLEAARWINAATGRIGVSHFHAISAAVADHAHRRLHVPPHLISVVPRARNFDELGTRDPDRRRRVRADLNIDERAPMILNVGRHERQKGQRHLLAAMDRIVRRHPDATLLIAGRLGNESASLAEQFRASNLGDSVRFLGQRDDVADLIAACDVFSFPSLWEGLGGSLIEAMALEAPIVAFDIPACREVVGDDGQLVAVGDSDALADSIVRALDDPLQSAAQATRGRARVCERYSMARMATGMTASYERALAAGPPPLRSWRSRP